MEQSQRTCTDTPSLQTRVGNLCICSSHLSSWIRPKGLFMSCLPPQPLISGLILNQWTHLVWCPLHCSPGADQQVHLACTSPATVSPELQQIRLPEPEQPSILSAPALNFLFPSLLQVTVQMVLVILALASVPVLLFGTPLYQYCQHWRQGSSPHRVRAQLGRGPGGHVSSCTPLDQGQ